MDICFNLTYTKLTSCKIKKCKTDIFQILISFEKHSLITIYNNLLKNKVIYLFVRIYLLKKGIVLTFTRIFVKNILMLAIVKFYY